MSTSLKTTIIFLLNTGLQTKAYLTFFACNSNRFEDCFKNRLTSSLPIKVFEWHSCKTLAYYNSLSKMGCHYYIYYIAMQ